MFYELSKLLNIFVISPVSWIFVLLVAGYLLKKRKWVRRGCWIGALAVFLVFGNLPLYQTIAYNSTKEFSSTELKKPHYEVAIVMGGFGDLNSQTGQFQGNQRADRLWETVRLYKEGKVDRILITGDATSRVEDDGSSKADLFLKYMDTFGVPDSVFILEQHARNSHENAVFTTEILNGMGIPADSCLLVTSVEHMDRSLKCFAREGFVPDYYPVGIYEQNRKLTFRSMYPSWETMAKWQGHFNEWIGDVAYRFMGYI